MSNQVLCCATRLVRRRNPAAHGVELAETDGYVYGKAYCKPSGELSVCEFWGCSVHARCFTSHPSPLLSGWVGKISLSAASFDCALCDRVLADEAPSSVYEPYHPQIQWSRGVKASPLTLGGLVALEHLPGLWPEDTGTNDKCESCSLGGESSRARDATSSTTTPRSA